MANCVSVYFTTNCKKGNGKGRPPAKQNEAGLQHNSGWNSVSYLSSWLFIQIIVFIIMHFNVHTITAGITLERNYLDSSHVYPPIQEKSVINVKKTFKISYSLILTSKFWTTHEDGESSSDSLGCVCWGCAAQGRIITVCYDHRGTYDGPFINRSVRRGAAQLVGCMLGKHAAWVPSRARHKLSMRVNTCNNQSEGSGGLSRVSAAGHSRVHSESEAWAAGDLISTKPNQAKTQIKPK